MCDRFHCLPSQAEAEDVSVLYRLRLEQLGRDPEGDEQDDEPG